MSYPSHPIGPGEVRRRFLLALSGTSAGKGGVDPVELLPDQLSRAAVTVLGGVDAAGISILDRDVRVPLGASDEPAARAERIQFTIGDGPCLAALHTGAPVSATVAELQVRWPTLAEQLLQHSPYRSEVALPIRLGGAAGTLDLYFADPLGSTAVDLDQATTVAHQISRTLTYTAWLPAGGRTGIEDQIPYAEPPWLDGPSPARRRIIWIAIGMISDHLSTTAGTSLDVLRAYAYSHDYDVDTVAAQLVTRAVSLSHLTAG